MSTQAQLIPDERVPGDLATVPLDVFPLLLPGPAPDHSFIASVQRFGVLQPVALIRALRNEGGPQGYIVAAGRRRIKAARAAELETIPAIVFPRGWAMADVLAIVENEQRSNNPASDVRAIMELARQGASHDEICAATGLPKGTLKKRMKLVGLHSELFRAFEQGQISTSVAEAAARLGEDRQATLYEVLRTTGKLRLKDVKGVLTAQTQEATAMLPDVLFATPGADATVSGDWRKHAGALIEQALAVVPEGQKPGLEYAVQSALQEAQRFLSTALEAGA
jgi:ParB/RepB/Spo0J family partition protein